MYDESIIVCDDDDDEEFELLASRRRPGVSPVRRAPFQSQQQANHHPNHTSQQQQRPTHSYQRSRQFQLSESLEFDGMSGEEDGLSEPPQREDQLTRAGKKMSSKDFTLQSSMDSKHENLISMASSYAKKLMSSSSEKAKEKLPPDVAEAKRREQTIPPHPPEMKKPSQAQLQLGSQSPSTSGQAQASAEDEEEDDDDDEDYDDDMNMAQIEGLLKRVDTVAYPSPGRFIPRPQTQTQAHSHSHTISSSRIDAIPDRGGAGDPYSVRHPQISLSPTASSTSHYLQQQVSAGGHGCLQPPQFQPGFGPATANLMGNFGGNHFDDISDDDSDLEISVSEGDVDFSRMDKLMEMYTRSSDTPNMEPATTMAVPEIASLGVMDDEVMENILAHRKIWEHQLDLKREALRRRVLVMSDILGVHSPGYEVYNPQDYEQLNVSPEIKELFHCITRYEPPMIGTQMDVKLKPFIPEYYPSVGDIDAFIKVIHPEIQDDHLGIKYLDEPSPFQSDPSVLDLRLRALAKQSSSKSVTVKKIDNVGKNAKIIENWIKDISDLHRSKPSPSVHYSKPMPDIDSLIQEWPPQLEDLLKNISLPSAELDCDLPTYVDIVCNLLDIPVYKSRIQSLHVLFTLYATYKHFNHYGPLGMGSAGAGSEGRGDLDHLLPSATSVRMEEGDVDRLQIS